ncbi:ATP-dependent DNA helicase Rep [Candidatus Hartigia pinicola]|nr:ATP-dependent DNA helicase Rep [Candidatus Hartigia pinicola]
MLLNLNQQLAVEFINGPCLVLAGAGSGKTRVITNKIIYLIRECAYNPRQIAALTFTNKAASEMKERLAQTLGKKAAKGLIISTFHSLGLEIIKREYQALKMNANFSLIDNQDQIALLKELTSDLLKKDKDLLQQLISSISNWKNDLVSPNQVLELEKSEKRKYFLECYHRYDLYLKSCNILDFDDLISYPTLLLLHNKDVRERWQKKIQYLLVDEYQDTNTSQYQLIKLLVGPTSRFTVVGDDNQSIYSWRGARPKNLILLSQDFPTLHVLKLEENYRSSGRILKAANILISNNPHLFKKKLFSKLNYGPTLKVLTAYNEEHEGEKVISELITHHFINKTQYKDYAILYRSNHQARIFEKILIKNRIPYRISGSTDFFSLPEIKDLIAYFRVITNPDDNSAFLRIINTPRREIGPKTIQKLGAWANQRGKSLYQSSFDLGLEQTLTGKGLVALKQFVYWIDKIIQQSKYEPLLVIRNLLCEINYESWLYEVSTNTKVVEMRMKNIKQLFSWISDMVKGNDLVDPMSLNQVVTRFTLRYILERSECDEQLNQVHLMTLHASKGLEFPYVFLVGMDEGLLPHQISIDQENINEERRLVYVGITRAQKELFFTHCSERRQHGECVFPDLSRFLLELPQDDLEWEEQHIVVSVKEKMQKGQSALADIKARLGLNK